MWEHIWKRVKYVKCVKYLETFENIWQIVNIVIFWFLPLLNINKKSCNMCDKNDAEKGNIFVKMLFTANKQMTFSEPYTN